MYLLYCLIAAASSIQQIQNRTATEGGNVTLYCNASGTPPLAISWIKEGVKLSNESTLQLKNISRSQAGDYRCEASNECGNLSEAVKIDVQCKLVHGL